MAEPIKPIYYYVDHTSRFAHNSGVQRCVRALARALLEQGQALIPVVWDRDKQQLAPASSLALEHLARWSGPAATAWSPWPEQGGDGWASWLLIVELVSGPHNPSPDQLRAAVKPRNLRMAWLFHDAIPLRLARLYGAAAPQAAATHGAYMAALASYERVFCNSHTTRRHLLAFLAEQGLAQSPELLSRIVALPLAEEFGGERAPPPPRQPPGAVLELLCVSTLEPRKNHRGLLKALAWLHSNGLHHWHLQLVGWGAEGWVVELVQRARQIGLAIEWHGRADDGSLEQLYRGCDLTLYPSLEEGFGLPVAEGLWHRRPCLCSGEGALGERAAGGGCLTVNTADWRSIASGLERLLMEPELRTQLSGEADIRPFRRWNDVAAELLAGLGPL